MLGLDRTYSGIEVHVNVYEICWERFIVSAQRRDVNEVLERTVVV